MTAAFLTGADARTEVPLKRRLKRSERARQIKALALVLPLLLFLLFTFAGPIAGMLWRSVDYGCVAQAARCPGRCTSCVTPLPSAFMT